MNRTSSYSEEISQTALALLALVAAGQSVNAATVRSLRSLLRPQSDSSGSLVHLTIFSDPDYDEEEKTELPDIIPFAELRPKVKQCHNGYGTLSLINQTSAYSNSDSWPRIFSPDISSSPDDDNTPCLATTTHALRIYKE